MIPCFFKIRYWDKINHSWIQSRSKTEYVYCQIKLILPCFEISTKIIVYPTPDPSETPLMSFYLMKYFSTEDAQPYSCSAMIELKSNANNSNKKYASLLLHSQEVLCS